MQNFEKQVFYRTPLLDVSECVKETRFDAGLADNPDMLAKIPGWPDTIATKPFCSFAVPHEIAGKTTTISVHTGMGRGLDNLPLPIPGSSFANKILNGEILLHPGDIGIYDETTGIFYTCIGTKGNGPTAEEQARAQRKLEGSEIRTYEKKKEGWGLLLTDSVEEIEKPTLDTLAQIGFRVGKVPFWFRVDGKKLNDAVYKYYKQNGYGDTYNLPYELKKNNNNITIMARMHGGVRCDVLAEEKANAHLIDQAIYGFSSEIAKAGRENFIKKYKIPQEMEPILDTISNYGYGNTTDIKTYEAYGTLISFIMQRNFYLQDEYNQKFPLTKEQIQTQYNQNANGLTLSDEEAEKLVGKVGPIWLNYKPGDWDIAGIMFDVDVFTVKIISAIDNGIDNERKKDLHAMNVGLNEYIGSKLKTLGVEDWNECIAKGKQYAYRVHTTLGFLDPKVEKKDFYSIED